MEVQASVPTGASAWAGAVATTDASAVQRPTSRARGVRLDDAPLRGVSGCGERIRHGGALPPGLTGAPPRGHLLVGGKSIAEEYRQDPDDCQCVPEFSFGELSGAGKVLTSREPPRLDLAEQSDFPPLRRSILEGTSMKLAYRRWLRWPRRWSA